MPSIYDQALAREIIQLRTAVGRELARMASGQAMSLGDIREEYVPELQPLKGRIGIFERMANDPHVRGQLRAISMTMFSGVRWKVEGGTKQMRDLVTANLLGEGDPALACSSSWLEFLHEALGCLIYGFSLYGLSWSVVNGRQILSDLTWLHPRSVDEDGWDMDDTDNLLGVRRTYQSAKMRQAAREFIPIEDLFLMTWDRRGPNWEGNAFIRPMYKPWKLGEIAEKIDIIDLQNRGVAIPVAHLSASGGVKERDSLVAILQSLRGASKERAFIALQNDEKIEFLTSQGQAKDAQPIIAHHKSGIVKAAGTEYFEQGNTATGSRAGASALATGFFINVNGIRIVFQDMINNGLRRMPGIVRMVVDRNFDNVKEYPRIIGSSVSPQEQLDNVPLMLDAHAKGVIPPNIKHANETARLLGWPELTPAEYEQARERAAASASPAIGGPGRPNEAGPDEQGRDDTEGRRLAMQEKKTANSGGSPRSMNRVSYPWLSLNQA